MNTNWSRKGLLLFQILVSFSLLKVTIDGLLSPWYFSSLNHTTINMEISICLNVPWWTENLNRVSCLMSSTSLKSSSAYTYDSFSLFVLPLSWCQCIVMNVNLRTIPLQQYFILFLPSYWNGSRFFVFTFLINWWQNTHKTLIRADTLTRNCRTFLKLWVYSFKITYHTWFIDIHWGVL